MPINQPNASHFGLILPLCTSSATVGLSLFQYPLFLSFIEARPSIAGKPLSRYWEPFLKQGGAVIIGTGLTSAVSGLISWNWLQNHAHLETTNVSQWYLYGALFSLAHFAFMPLVATPIKNMIDAAGEGDGAKSESDIDESNRKEMATWLIWHTLRSVLADLPALACFAEGAALSFWVI